MSLNNTTGLRLKDKKTNESARQNTWVTDLVERWEKEVTEWQARTNKRSPARSKARLKDDI